MKVAVVDTTGAELRQIDVADEVFGIEPNRAVVHQAYVIQMANRRAGNAHTKTRGEVRGSSAKIRRQKGLGRARLGTIRAPQLKGGGVAHGPRRRSFAREMPRQMRRLALRSALSSHAAAGTLLVVEGLTPSEPKTKLMAATLKALGIERRALLVSGEPDEVLIRASRNIENVKAVPARNISVVDLVNAHRLVMTEEAVRQVEELWGGDNLKPARGVKTEAVNA